MKVMARAFYEGPEIGLVNAVLDRLAGKWPLGFPCKRKRRARRTPCRRWMGKQPWVLMNLG